MRFPLNWKNTFKRIIAKGLYPEKIHIFVKNQHIEIMKTISFLAAILLFTACSNNNQNQNTEENTTNQVQQITVDEFFVNPANYMDQEISISGLVVHVCKHGGQKLFITGQDDQQTLRINTGNDIPEFALELEGSNALFTGMVEQMDEEFVAQTIAKEREHHGDEAEGLHAEDKSNRNMQYYLVAKNFKLQ